MPPKKAATNGNASDLGGVRSLDFTISGPDLLLLTQGRYVKPEEYAQLSTAFPGTTKGSIRNRVSALRVKQRDLYEKLGWKVPEGGAGHSATKAKGGKRGISEDDLADPETPTKKPSAKKAKKEAAMQKEDSDDLSGGDEDARVKEEEFEIEV
ncbi:Nn.00g069710.m01.CDS01 [Neocucurbitaria sp. VM-36]